MPSYTYRPRRTHLTKRGGRFAAVVARLVTASLISFCLVPTVVSASPPSGYYNTVVTDSPLQLRTTLHNVIDDHTRYPYTASSTDTWTILEIADQNPANSAHILDLYRNRSLVKFGGGTGPYNREHTWPNSYGFPDDGGTNYPYTDCHHLFLCDVGYNNDRANKPYGAAQAGSTERVTDVNGGQGGGSGVFPGNSNWFTATVWRTWSGRKGDVARAMFYMDVRYEGGTHGVSGAAEPNLILTDDIGQIVTTGTNASTAYMGLLSVLIVWNAEDPPDAREQAHNDAVYSFQGNRNPFVDHPEWVNALFVPSTGPTIASIQDVPADQGGSLQINWQRNSLDVAGSAWPIDHYTIQRLAGTWVDVATVSANASASYTTTIPTSDISEPGNPQPFSQYRVLAVEHGGTVRPSTATSAYSIDNLAPPAPVASLDESGTPHIVSWGAPAIPDFDQACVYRGDDTGFVPGAPLACTAGTSYNEYDTTPQHFYVVRFADTHGNLSPFSNEVSSTVSGVPDGGSGRLTAITQVSPNPFGLRTSIVFSLAEPGSVHIDLFSADGRLVRTLLNEARHAGAFEVAWDGTNNQGEPVANGPYFVRLSSNGRVNTRKVLLVR
jgi:endonuclease I